MNIKNYFIPVLMVLAFLSGCAPSAGRTPDIPTESSTPLHIATVTTASSPTLLSSTPILSQETLQDCVEIDVNTKSQISLRGAAVIRSLSSEVLGLEMSLLDLATGDVTEISTPNPVDFASVSPDRKTLAYIRFNASNSMRELVLVDAMGEIQKIPWSSEKDFGFEGWLNSQQIVILQDSKFIIVEVIQDSQFSVSPSDFPGFDAYQSHFSIVFDPSIARAIYKDGEINLFDLSQKTIIARIDDSYDRAPIAAWQSSGEQAAVVGTISTEQETHGSPDEIFIVEKNGQVSQLTHLYDNFGLVLTIDSLAWSPDGQKIAFWLLDGEGNETLRIADAITGVVTNYCILNVTVTRFPISVAAPIWSPDGRYLMVENRYSADDNNLLVVDLINRIAIPIAENGSPVGWMEY